MFFVLQESKCGNILWPTSSVFRTKKRVQDRRTDGQNAAHCCIWPRIKWQVDVLMKFVARLAVGNRSPSLPARQVSYGVVYTPPSVKRIINRWRPPAIVPCCWDCCCFLTTSAYL